MNKLFAILGLIGAILGLIFSFLPISNLAIFPAIIGLVLGLIAYSAAKKQNIGFSFARIVVILSLLAIIISASKQLFFKNKVEEDIQFIEKTKKSEQDAVKELEELDELEDLE
ncbi:MAG: FUSC family protein [Flavobacteriaceae bacterium]|nr:FUSC family protein [Flavobacteriaceae bacterium]